MITTASWLLREPGRNWLSIPFAHPVLACSSCSPRAGSLGGEASARWLGWLLGPLAFLSTPLVPLLLPAELRG